MLSSFSFVSVATVFVGLQSGHAAFLAPQPLSTNEQRAGVATTGNDAGAGTFRHISNVGFLEDEETTPVVAGHALTEFSSEEEELYGRSLQRASAQRARGAAKKGLAAGLFLGAAGLMGSLLGGGVVTNTPGGGAVPNTIMGPAAMMDQIISKSEDRPWFYSCQNTPGQEFDFDPEDCRYEGCATLAWTPFCFRGHCRRRALDNTGCCEGKPNGHVANNDGAWCVDGRYLDHFCPDKGTDSATFPWASALDANVGEMNCGGSSSSSSNGQGTSNGKNARNAPGVNGWAKKLVDNLFVSPGSGSNVAWRQSCTTDAECDYNECLGGHGREPHCFENSLCVSRQANADECDGQPIGAPMSGHSWCTNASLRDYLCVPNPNPLPTTTSSTSTTQETTSTLTSTGTTTEEVKNETSNETSNSPSAGDSNVTTSSSDKNDGENQTAATTKRPVKKDIEKKDIEKKDKVQSTAKAEDTKNATTTSAEKEDIKTTSAEKLADSTEDKTASNATEEEVSTSKKTAKNTTLLKKGENQSAEEAEG